MATNKTNKFWEIQENITFWQNYYLNAEIKEWQEIVEDWNYSSVQLKNWLDKYYPTELGLYDKEANINVNVILPYLHNRYWLTDNLYRLDLALKAKLIILGMNGLDEIRKVYAVEALRLWLRFDSTKTKLSWKEFVNKVDKAYIETEQDWEGTVDLIQKKCEELKPTYKKIMYHYQAEDFNLIQENMTLSEAYNFWLEMTFPTLLENFKNLKKKELYNKELNNLKYGENINYEQYNVKLEKLEAELQDLKFIKPTIRFFRKLLSNFNIKYKKSR